MARPISKVAPAWWDYTTLDVEILADAARLSADDLLQLARPGFEVRIYDTFEDFWLAEALEYINAYEKMYGSKPATFGANVYDAGLLLTRAVPEAARRGRPGTPEFRAALRDALEATRELVGTQGVYNMSAADHSGFDERGRVLITVKDGNWRLLRD